MTKNADVAEEPVHNSDIGDQRSEPDQAPDELHIALDEIGNLIGSGASRARQAGESLEPAWERVTEGETRWPVSVVVLVAIVLQLILPHRLAVHPIWLLPAVEAMLLTGLIAANPKQITRRSNRLRATSIVLIAMTSFGNAWSAGHLIHALINGRAGQDAGPLLADGGAIWLTNVIVFGLWYWELDRGGPAARAHAPRPYPDFQFPQMENPSLAPPGWEPHFWDYFYVSFTNAIAFSPTDSMPLARWAKLTMLLQSAVSISTVALVIARAVNILK